MVALMEATQGASQVGVCTKLHSAAAASSGSCLTASDWTRESEAANPDRAEAAAEAAAGQPVCGGGVKGFLLSDFLPSRCIRLGWGGGQACGGGGCGSPVEEMALSGPRPSGPCWLTAQPPLKGGLPCSAGSLGSCARTHTQIGSAGDPLGESGSRPGPGQPSQPPSAATT